jgi:copper transport protein
VAVTADIRAGTPRPFVRVTCAAFLFLLCLGITAPALAHAVLLNARPQDGQVLPDAPKAVSLTFNEPVEMIRLQLVHSDGTVVGATQHWDIGDSFTWTLPEKLADGGWLLSYSVISADSHPVSGTLKLVVGEGDATFAERPVESRAATQYPRFLVLAGTLSVVGLLLAGAALGWLADRPMRIAMLAGVLIAIAGGGWSIYETAAATGGGPTAMAAALHVLGPGLAITLAGLLGGFALTWLGVRRLLWVFAIIDLVGLALTGHAAAAPPAWLARPVYLIHIGVAALWLGSLFLLMWRHRSHRALVETTVGATPPGASPGGAGLGEVLIRFSVLAPWLVGLLVIAGVVMLFMQAGTADALAHSQYGLFFAIKIALVMLLLGVAGHNRWRLTRPALAGQAWAERLLRGAVWVELVLFAGIFGMAALLGTTVPPRAIVEANALPPCSATGPLVNDGRDIDVDIKVTLQSACSGRNNISVAINGEDGQPIRAQEVMVRFALPDLHVEPFDVYLEPNGATFSTSGYDLPLAGKWHIETRIILDEFTLRRTVFSVPLAAR